jgi:V-type H+-transporting ATPase subunit D
MKLLIEKKKMVKKLFLKAYLSIAESEWSAGNFSQQIINQVNRASCTLDISFNNIAGVSLPTFIQREDDSFMLEKIALTRGSAQIEKARNHFKELIDVLVDIASLQTSFVKLD